MLRNSTFRISPEKCREAFKFAGASSQRRYAEVLGIAPETLNRFLHGHRTKHNIRLDVATQLFAREVYCGAIPVGLFNRLKPRKKKALRGL